MKLQLIPLLALLALAPAQAVTITNPLTLQKAFVAGLYNGQNGNSNIATETLIAQTILDLGLGAVAGHYETNTVFNYGGTITADFGQHPDLIEGDGVVNIPAGFGGALAKYDGPNGGYVLYLFGGQASVIPEFPYNFWTTNTEQYRISHYTLFDGNGDITPTPQGVPTPDGGATLSMLGLALAGLGAARRKLGL